MCHFDYDYKYKCACKGNHCLCYKKSKDADWTPFHIVRDEEPKRVCEKKECRTKPDFDRFYKCVCKDGKCACWKADKGGPWERIEWKKDNKKAKCCSKHKSSDHPMAFDADRFYKCACKGGKCICWKREKGGKWELVEKKKECTKPCCTKKRVCVKEKKAHHHKRHHKRTQVTQSDADFLKDLCFYY